MIASIVETIGHLLPDQRPLEVFVHHNTLHALEYLPFHDALRRATETYRARAYLPEDEVLRHEETGLLVPPADPTARADALCRLLDDPGLAARLSRTAQADSRRYDIRTTVEALEEIYADLIERVPKAA